MELHYQNIKRFFQNRTAYVLFVLTKIRKDFALTMTIAQVKLGDYCAINAIKRLAHLEMIQISSEEQLFI